VPSVDSVRKYTSRRAGDVFEMRFGERRTVPMVFRDANGDPIDLTGWSVSLNTAYFTADTSALGDFTSDLPMTADTSGKSKQTIAVTIDPDQTANKGQASFEISDDDFFGGVNPALGEVEESPVVLCELTFTSSSGEVTKRYFRIVVRGSVP